MIRWLKKKVKGSDYLLSVLAFLYFRALGRNKIKSKGSNNEVLVNAAFLKKCDIAFFGSGNKVVVAKGAILNGVKINVYGCDNEIRIGAFSILNGAEFWCEDDKNAIILGAQTTVNGGTQFATIEGTRIIVGVDCMFSSDVLLRTGDSHSIIDETGRRTNHSKTVIIGNHVWLGNRTTVNKGVKIADNIILGAGSMMTKSCNESCVTLAGTPAKVVARGTNWLRERI
jgi:acetyltransferase-like isoleucine patch superfamily enzyme